MWAKIISKIKKKEEGNLINKQRKTRFYNSLFLDFKFFVSILCYNVI